jgi:general secretion pathway protein E
MSFQRDHWIHQEFDLAFWQERELLPVFAETNLETIGITKHSRLEDINRFRFVTTESFALKSVSADEVTSGLNDLADLLSGSEAHKVVEKQSPRAQSEIVSSSVVMTVNDLIRDAVTQGASDIHFEPFEDYLLVRFRVDGVLREVLRLETTVTAATISRLKIMGGLDIAERRLPQDGRIRFHDNGKVIDVRLSTLPTEYGEKAVLRILDKSALRLDLNILGMNSDSLSMFRKHLNRSSGIILVTGPTGSGKTTTLYSALNEIHTSALNITTIEDPIEYNLEGINQTQIKPEIGLTFAHVLRSTLRQDPNIIMVGEIRDAETLRIALQAALTGHLVLSTLHTNDSVAAISRLIDLSADRGLLATALRLVIAQRLLKTLCEHCKKPAGDATETGLFAPVGCERCYDTGYVGRQAVFEFLEVGKDFSGALEKGATGAELRSIADEQGLIGLRSSALALARQGITDTHQALRETA